MALKGATITFGGRVNTDGGRFGLLDQSGHFETQNLSGGKSDDPFGDSPSSLPLTENQTRTSI